MCVCVECVYMCVLGECRYMCNERVILRLCCQYIVNQRECCSSRRLNSRNVVRDDRIYNNRRAEIMMGKEHAGKP